MWVSVCGVCVGHRGGGLVCGPWDSQGDGGCNFYFCWFCLGFLIGVLLVSVEQGVFGVVLCVGRVAGLQGWVAEKSCHSQTLINECSVFDWPSGFGGLWLIPHAVLFQAVFCLVFLWSYVFFSGWGLGQGRGDGDHIFRPLGDPSGRALGCFFCASRVLPLQAGSYICVLIGLFLGLYVGAVWVHLIF